DCLPRRFLIRRTGLDAFADGALAWPVPPCHRTRHDGNRSGIGTIRLAEVSALEEWDTDRGEIGGAYRLEIGIRVPGLRFRRLPFERVGIIPTDGIGKRAKQH